MVSAARKNPSLEDRLAALGELRMDPASARARQELSKALTARISLLAAKAARIAGESGLADLTPQLVDPFQRFLVHPETTDKGCAAKTEIARALQRLECPSPELFLRGIRHVQMEPTWTGPVDTAAELRGVCALGLAQTGYRDAGLELARLLADRERQARIGAVRAIAWWVRPEGLLLLRFKALSGDAEPEVIGECLSALLRMEPEGSLPFVAEFLEHADPAVAEGAALALGESRQEAAFEILKGKLRSPLRQVALMAIGMMRRDYLEQLAAAGDQEAKTALESLYG